MANHCYNYVTLNGDAEILEEISKKLRTYDKFNYITNFFDYVLNKITFPPDLVDNNDDLDNNGVRDYNYYGTKWWDMHVNIEGIEDDVLTISGDTAWAPPLQFIEELCIQYDLCATCEYEEPGMDIAGIATYSENGYEDHKQMTYREYQYSNNYDAWFEDALYCLEDLLEEENSQEEIHNYCKELLHYCTKGDIDELLIELKELKDE
jgi:hypothetical protein